MTDNEIEFVTVIFYMNYLKCNATLAHFPSCKIRSHICCRNN